MFMPVGTAASGVSVLTPAFRQLLTDFRGTTNSGYPSFSLQARQEQAQLEQQQWLQMQQVLQQQQLAAQQQQQQILQQQQQQQTVTPSSDAGSSVPATASSEQTQTGDKQEGGPKSAVWVPSVGNISIPPFPKPSNDEDDDYS